MLHFVIRRLLVTIPMVFVVITLTWVLIRLAPGNFYATERALSPAVEENIRAKYGLDQPWYVQYGRMLGNAVRGDLGTSLQYEGRPVNEILARFFDSTWCGRCFRRSARWNGSEGPRGPHLCKQAVHTGIGVFHTLSPGVHRPLWTTDFPWPPPAPYGQASHTRGSLRTTVSARLVAQVLGVGVRTVRGVGETDRREHL